MISSLKAGGGRSGGEFRGDAVAEPWSRWPSTLKRTCTHLASFVTAFISAVPLALTSPSCFCAARSASRARPSLRCRVRTAFCGEERVLSQRKPIIMCMCERNPGTHLLGGDLLGQRLRLAGLIQQLLLRLLQRCFGLLQRLGASLELLCRARKGAWAHKPPQQTRVPQLRQLTFETSSVSLSIALFWASAGQMSLREGASMATRSMGSTHPGPPCRR